MNNGKVAQCLTDILSFRLPQCEHRITMLQNRINQIMKKNDAPLTESDVRTIVDEVLSNTNVNINEDRVLELIEEKLKDFKPSGGSSGDSSSSSPIDPTRDPYAYYYYLYNTKQFDKFPDYVLFDDGSKRCWTSIDEVIDNYEFYSVTTVIYNDVNTFNWCGYMSEEEKENHKLNGYSFEVCDKVIGIGHHQIQQEYRHYPYDWNPDYYEDKIMYIDPFPCINQLFPRVEIVDLSERYSYNGSGVVNKSYYETFDYKDTDNYIGSTCYKLNTVILPKTITNPIPELCAGKNIKHIINDEYIINNCYNDHKMYVDYCPAEIRIKPGLTSFNSHTLGNLNIPVLKLPEFCVNFSFAHYAVSPNDCERKRSRYEELILPRYVNADNDYKFATTAKKITIPEEYSLEYNDYWESTDSLIIGSSYYDNKIYGGDSMTVFDLRNHKNMKFVPCFENAMLNAEIYLPYHAEEIKMPIQLNTLLYYKEQGYVNYDEKPIHIYDCITTLHRHINTPDDALKTMYEISELPNNIKYIHTHKPIYLHYRKNRGYDYTQHPVYQMYQQIDAQDGTDFLSDITIVEEEENAW